MNRRAINVVSFDFLPSSNDDEACSPQVVETPGAFSRTPPRPASFLERGRALEQSLERVCNAQEAGFQHVVTFLLPHHARTPVEAETVDPTEEIRRKIRENDVVSEPEYCSSHVLRPLYRLHMEGVCSGDIPRVGGFFRGLSADR